MRFSLFILSFFTYFFSNSQEKNPDFYNRPFVIFEGCDDAEDKERCYDIYFSEFLAKHLNSSPLKDSIFNTIEKDTLTIHTTIVYDEKGLIVKDYSYISNPLRNRKGGKNPFKFILDSIPAVKPVLDDYDNGVSSDVRSTYGYLLDRTKSTLIPIMGFTPNEIPFNIIEKVPIYKGCDQSLSNIELKDCMNKKVREIVSRNFNGKLASKLGLNNGVIRIFTSFKVDKKGKITDIRARGPHKALEEEAIRVIKKIPRLKKPGYFKDKPVIVPFSLPIVFRITE